MDLIRPLLGSVASVQASAEDPPQAPPRLAAGEPGIMPDPLHADAAPPNGVFTDR
jgi:hypothetical protein